LEKLISDLCKGPNRPWSAGFQPACSLVLEPPAGKMPAPQYLCSWLNLFDYRALEKPFTDLFAGQIVLVC